MLLQILDVVRMKTVKRLIGQALRRMLTWERRYDKSWGTRDRSGRHPGSLSEPSEL